MSDDRSGVHPTPRHVPQEPVALLLAGVGMPAPGEQTRRASHGLEALLEAAEPVPAEPSPAQHTDPAPPRSEVDERLEAVLMIADAPQSVAALATALDRPMAVVRQALARLRDDYDGLGGGPRRGFELRQLATGWRIVIRPDHDALVREFLRLDVPAKLSQAALETLAVVAYRQPVSRGQIAAVRAVSVDSVMRTLQARGLVDEVGQDPVSGAILYGTTDAMLEALGIRSIEELPPIAPLLQDAGEVASHVG